MPTPPPAGAQDGSGTWNTANVNWWNGTTDVAWAAANVAVFGAGTDGTYAITLGNATTAQAMTFSNGGYTLSAASALTLFPDQYRKRRHHLRLRQNSPPSAAMPPSPSPPTAIQAPARISPPAAFSTSTSGGTLTAGQGR